MDNVTYWGKAQPAKAATKPSFEDRLSAIVLRVEKSGWSDEDKEALYARISEYLHAIVLPVVLKYTSADELKALASVSPKEHIDAFVHVMQKPFGNPEMYAELKETMDVVLDDVETALSKGGIA